MTDPMDARLRADARAALADDTLMARVRTVADRSRYVSERLDDASDSAAYRRACAHNWALRLLRQALDGRPETGADGYCTREALERAIAILTGGDDGTS